MSLQCQTTLRTSTSLTLSSILWKPKRFPSTGTWQPWLPNQFLLPWPNSNYLCKIHVSHSNHVLSLITEIQLGAYMLSWSIKPSLVLIFSTLVTWLHVMSHMQWAPSLHICLWTNLLSISHLNTLVHLGCHSITKTKQGPFTRGWRCTAKGVVVPLPYFSWGCPFCGFH